MPARVGLEYTGLPSDQCHLLTEEDELEEALSGSYVTSDRSEEEDNNDSPSPSNVDALYVRA